MNTILTKYICRQKQHNMQELDWFETWFNSPYYHLLYNHRDEEEALRFINKLIDKLEPEQGSRMLDLACGKGRHSKSLWEKGFDVTGVDLSENSIIAAKEYECDTLRFYTHDMRFPLVSNYFDYTFNFFTSFGYFETEREHINTLRTMSSSLKKDGKLVIDFLNTSLPELNNTTEDTKILENNRFETRKWATDKHLFKSIKVYEGNSDKLLISFEERVARFNLQDFEHLFSFANLELTEVLGDHNLNAFDPLVSPRLILFAKKKA